MRVWAGLLGVEGAIIEDVGFEEATGALVVSVRLRRRDRGRCGICQRRCPGYDGVDGRRRWRALDLGTTRAYLEADASRVTCGEHGVTVVAVPWARHGMGHTRSFGDTVAWRTVGSIVERVAVDARAGHDGLDGLVRIGVDEVSHRKGHRYLTVVVDHDTGSLVWAAEGRSEATLEGLFEALGDERCARIGLVSADGAAWIERVVARRCPDATLCMDPFHVVAFPDRGARRRPT